MDKNMKKMILIMGTVLLFLNLGAYTGQGTIDPNGWRNNSRSHSLPVTLTPGEPKLPYLTLNVLLPFGESYTGADFQTGEYQLVASGESLPLAAQQLPVGTDPGLAAPALPALENRLYPARNWEYLGTQVYRGYQIAMFNLYPYKYNPLTREVYAIADYRLTVNSAFDRAQAQKIANFVTDSPETLANLNTLVQNPAACQSYQQAAQYRTAVPQNRLIDLGTPKKMLIITDTQRVPWFDQYAAWKTSKGISNLVVSTADIYSSYPGADNAEKVRNFIIAAYQAWATTTTPLEYVILGGDDEVVPERSAYGQVGDTVDAHMPVDIYFSNLDGNWNANQNDIYGEQNDDTDLLPEVNIGRLPAQTQREFDNMFRKTRYYADNNTWSNNTALFLGENLNNNPVTWGGDYKDDVATYLPTSYVLRTMYQRDGTYSENGVWNAINNGAGVMNHMGHANQTFLIGQSNNTIESLRNTEYGFLYSQGCYPAAFDQRTSGDGESIGEHLVTADGALFAFIGNTRYGWYAPGSVDGASEYYDRQYFSGLFEQNRPQLGKALTYSRLQNVNAAMSNDVMRWCYYEVVLFGDPSIAVKPADPAMPLLSMDHYTFSDVEGDNDGEISANEIIRLYPVISNHQDWATAYNVSVQVESANQGIQVLDGGLTIPQIYPGGMSPETSYLRLQMPADMGYGTFHITIVVEAHDQQTGLGNGARRFDASFEITLLVDGFPWEQGGAGKSAPLVGDFNHNQAGNEILYTDVFGNGYLINGQGQSSHLFNGPEDTYLTRSFASGMVDQNNSDDLVFASRSGDIYAVSQNGAPIYNSHFNTMFLFTPVLADVDGNAGLETIAGGMDGNVYVLSATGTLLPGFPFNVGGAFQSELAAADLDNDNAWEIVCGGSQGNLYVLEAGGAVKQGFPVQLDGALTGAPTITNNNRIVCSTATTAYIISPTGQVVSQRTIDAPIAGGFAIGDLDHDLTSAEVVGVSGSGTVYAFTTDGADLPGFPVSTGVYFTCPPLLANLDSDPQLEILLHSYVNSVYCYNHDGSPVTGFPFISTMNGATPGSLVHMNDDGDVNLVLGHSNGVMMLNLHRPESQLSPWVTYRGSALRQGSYASTGASAAEDELNVPPVNLLQQNYPNPFTTNTRIEYSIAKNAPVKMEIYNLKGQKVATWNLPQQSAGKHDLQWDGKDAKGNPVSSGVYLYRLQTGNETFTRRMLHLK